MIQKRSYFEYISNLTKLTNQELRTLTVIIVVSIVQGVISCCDVIWSYFYKDSYQLDPAEASSVSSTLRIPWTIKILWGIASDNIALFGYKRKSYLLITAILGWASFTNFGLWLPPFALGYAILMLLNIAQSFQSVVAQALVVENAQDANKKHNGNEEAKAKAASTGISLFFGAKFTGRMIYSLFITFFLVEDQKAGFLFATSFVFIPTVIVSFILPEVTNKSLNSVAQETSSTVVNPDLVSPLQTTSMVEPSPTGNRNFRTLKKTFTFLKNPLILKSVVLMFLSTFAPSAGQAKFYFYTTTLGFSSGFMGAIRLVSCGATLVAIILYGKYCANVNLRRFYGWTIVICSLFTLSQLLLILRVNGSLGIPDSVFALADTFVSEVAGELNGLPVLVLACRICPKNIEATIFAILISASDLSITVSQSVGAFFVSMLGITSTNFDNLWIMIIITATFQYSPFLILWSVDYEKGINDLDLQPAAENQMDNTIMPSSQEANIDLENKEGNTSRVISSKTTVCS